MIPSAIESPAKISQHFNGRPEVYKQFGMDGHNGIDFAVPTGTSVFTPYDAIVYEVGDQGKTGYGKFIRIRTVPNSKGIRREVVFAHLSKQLVKAGDWVNLGDEIGRSGNTGFSSGPHLHVGLRRVAPDDSIVQFGNGFRGYEDFEPYLLFWKRKGPDMVTYPNG